jgi:hypothetical protein
VKFIELIQNLFDERIYPGQTLWTSLRAFLPEIILCATIVAILLTRIFLASWKSLSYYIMLSGTAVALYFAVPWNWFPEGVSAAATPP